MISGLPTPPLEVRMRRLAELCFAAAAGIALAMLLLWCSGQWRLGTLGGENVPMAPDTAGLLLALAGAAWLRLHRPDSAAVSRLGAAVGFLVLAAALLIGGQFMFKFQWPPAPWLARAAETVGRIPVGKMSPLTALGFFLAGLAFRLGPSIRSRRPLRQAGAVLATAVLLLGSGVALGYALDAPLMYAGTVVPMAASTALVFILLGAGLMLAAGTDTWPLGLFVPPAAEILPARRFAWGFLALALVLVAAINAMGWFYFQHQRAGVRRASEELLATIADLKVRQIANWYAERQADAGVILDSPMITGGLQQFLARPADGPARKNLLVWMESLQRREGYDNVALFDAQGDRCLSVPAASGVHAVGRFQDALRARTVVTVDLHRDQSGRLIQLSLLVPIGIKPQADRPADGVLLLTVDPRSFLYPLVQAWPTPSRTAETMLVRREGGEVVYLNEVRHRRNSALTLRLPFDQPDLPAARAVRGQSGVVAGVDYRGVPVLAATREIPGTPWSMVAKIDREEIYAPVRRQAWITALLVGTMVLASMLSVGLLWRQRDFVFSRRELAAHQRAEAALREAHAQLERRVAERTEALKKSLEEADDLYERAPCGYHSLDADGTYLRVNATELNWLGYARDEVVGRMKFMDLVTPKGRKLFQETFPLFKERGRVNDLEFEMVRKDGTILPVLLNATAIKDDRGRFVMSRSTAVDISERHQADEARRQAHEQLELRVRERTAELVKTNESLQAEIRERKLAEERSQAAQAETSRLLVQAEESRRTLLALVENQKKTADALCESQELYRSFVEHLPAGVFRKDREGRYVFVNQMFCRLKGLGADEILGKTPGELAECQADQEAVGRPAARAGQRTLVAQGAADHESILRTGQPIELEEAYPQPDGTTAYFRVIKSPVFGADGRVIGSQGVQFDITERKRLEAERLGMEAQLRQQQKLESLGTLASGVAHEINNPINGIMNYAQLIQDRLERGSALVEYTGEILRETQRVAGIVRNLLTFSRNEKQSHSFARIGDIVEQTLSLIRTVIRHDRIELQVDVPADLPDLKCRSQQIQQVLMNLMTNARDALNERYPGHDPDKRMSVVARLLQTDGRRRIRVTVEDHGTGIKPAVRERMFDPFFTTKPRDQGTGLGLSISHGIVKEHLGEITVETEPGHFTRMHVDLPVDNGWTV